MAVKVKELKDDAKLKIEVNKAYYITLKNTLMFILDQQTKTSSEEEILKSVEQVKETKYEDMNDFQRSFYTVTLAIAEIENQAINDPSLHEEKEILEPGDEGYVEPTLD